MKTLEEVKEYFKNAIEVKDYKGDKGFVELEKIKENAGCFIQNPFKDNWIVLYHDKKGYAKIKTKKEKIIYSITKEQLRQLTDPKIKEWFPEVFETKLEVGKWYKYEDCLFCYQKELNVYGFSDNEWDKCSNGAWSWSITKGLTEATEQEVKTALENEAIKRGFKEGVCYMNARFGNEETAITNYFEYMDTTLYLDGNIIFYNGKWATIIPTLTKKEAEEKLGVKII